MLQHNATNVVKLKSRLYKEEKLIILKQNWFHLLNVIHTRTRFACPSAFEHQPPRDLANITCYCREDKLCSCQILTTSSGLFLVWFCIYIDFHSLQQLTDCDSLSLHPALPLWVIRIYSALLFANAKPYSLNLSVWSHNIPYHWRFRSHVNFINLINVWFKTDIEINQTAQRHCICTPKYNMLMSLQEIFISNMYI